MGSQSLQIWETRGDGIIVLAHDRSYRLCVAENKKVMLLSEDGPHSHTPLTWSASDASDLLRGEHIFSCAMPRLGTSLTLTSDQVDVIGGTAVPIDRRSQSESEGADSALQCQDEEPTSQNLHRD